MSAMVARGGIDLGGTKIQAVVVDGRWNVLGQSRRPTPTDGGPGDVAEQMAEALREAALEAGVRPSELAGGGVGSPGDVNEATGAVSQARNLPGWDGTFQLGKWLAKSLGTPISVGNDVQVATNAEAQLGAGRHSSPCWESSGERVWAAGSSSMASRGWAAEPPARSATWW